MPEVKGIKLVLEDGTVFEGKSFGYHKSAAGEVVFNTGMAGYPESLTDPSYKGQLLLATFPLIGNYGVPVEDKDEHGIPLNYESDHIQVSGLIISDYSFEYSHWNAKSSLSDWLIENKVPGIYGIDTRELTKILREKGSMLAKILVEGEDIAQYDPNQENLVAQVSVKKPKVYGKGKHRVVLVDTGTKNSILRNLLSKDTTVTQVPWDYDFTKEDYDGVVLSSGPGNPQMCKATIENIKKAIGIGKPIFGIGLGNQLLGIAGGASTYKLKYGHRAQNIPVIKVGSDTCYITSQNHGYALDTDSLTDDWKTTFANLNDNSNEGIKHRSKPFFAVQFYPETSCGPTENGFLFDDFIKLVEENKK